MKPFAIKTALALALACGTALAQQPATRPATAQTDVPVKTVVLFSSGVGYFEHAGTVRGDGSTELRFKTNQINDILKSLVLQDEDGGKVSTITYPSQDPISKTLRSFQVDITNNPSLADLLNQLRGAKVTITAQAEKFSGTVLGVETRKKPVDKGEPVDVSVINILTGATIRAIELQSISSLSLDDQQLQDELNKALTALTQARDQDKKPVTINFTGQGERHVRIGYVVETPIWKTSYRLILDDKAGNKLQGWAIVENQTESDWNNVSLSLVSGRPISFVMDLYQPLYVARPTVVQELYASLRPQVYDAGMGREQAEAATFGLAGAGRGGGGGFGAGAAAGGRGGRGGAAGVPAAAPAQAQQLAQQMYSEARLSSNAPMDYASSIQSVANAAKIGELFQYTVGNVTLPRQKSAMLPIITDNIEVEKLSIYNASVLSKNPLNGARVKNTTNKHLLQGPVTVLDGNSYAGDARIDNLPPGQERLLSYGIDLQVLVDNTKNTQDSSVLSGKITKGMLEIQRKYVAKMEYLIENKGDAARTIIIEHPIRSGWTLASGTPKPIETTQTVYRFKDSVQTAKPSKLTVGEEMVRSDTLAMLPADIGQLAFYSRTGEIPKEVRDALAKAISLKQAISDTDRQIAECSKQVNDIVQDQSRIRENMKTVEQKSKYYEDLLAKLSTQETQIEKLQAQRDDLQHKRDQQQKELEDYLGNLNVG